VLLLLLGCCFRRPAGLRRPNRRARAAATGHPDGQDAASAAAHAEVIAAAAPDALAATLAATLIARGAARSLHTGLTARGRAETMRKRPKGRVGTVEMDAGGRPGLGWWWWLRQGPGSRCVARRRSSRLRSRGRKAGFERAAYLRSEMRPRSPMKDKPTTRRPPAGLGMDDPDPLGSVAALANPEAPRRADICSA